MFGAKALASKTSGAEIRATRPGSTRSTAVLELAQSRSQELMKRGEREF
jgi:hypothetical protein